MEIKEEIVWNGLNPASPPTSRKDKSLRNFPTTFRTFFFAIKNEHNWVSSVILGILSPGGLTGEILLLAALPVNNWHRHRGKPGPAQGATHINECFKER